MKVAFPLAKKYFSSIRYNSSCFSNWCKRNTWFQKKIYGSGKITLKISNKELNDTMKIVQALEDSNILLKGVTKIKTKQKNKKEDFYLCY